MLKIIIQKEKKKNSFQHRIQQNFKCQQKKSKFKIFSVAKNSKIIKNCDNLFVLFLGKDYGYQ